MTNKNKEVNFKNNSGNDIENSCEKISQNRYEIDHDLPGCISCEACCVVCPDNWEMKEILDLNGDVKAVPKKVQLNEEEFQSNMDAACSCPVNVIHIIDKKSGKKLI